MVTDNIKSLFFEGLKEYLVEENEEWLTHAYDLGREAVRDGLSEIDIINLHHETLIKLEKSDPGLDYEKKIERASTYLKEWLAPFDVKLESYRSVIDQLQKQNEQLTEEIDSRREAQRELASSKEYFQSLIENAQDIISVLDHNGIIRYSSPSIKRILGYVRGELVGREVFQYVHENDQERVQELFKELINTPEDILSIEFRFKHKDGSWVYLESIAKNVHDSPDGPIVIVNSRDVTERKRNIRKLEEHKMQLANAQRIANVGSWEWRPGQEVKWSDEMCRIYGFDPENFDNKYETYITHVHPDDRVRYEERVNRALEEKESFSAEHRIIRPGGEERVVLGRGHVVTDEDGEVVKMIGTGQDVTEQKEREGKLREYSDRLRNLSEKLERAREEERIKIARQVHDDLGQMLTVLKMDVSMLSGEMKKKVSDDTLEYFNAQAAKILDRINVIIKSVQRITTELRPEILDDAGFQQAIEWQAGEFEKRTGIKINFKSNVKNTNFLDDDKATTLFRIFQETLTNIVRHAKASVVEIKLKKQEMSLFLVIRDNGVGITEEQKEASSSMGIIGMRERIQFLDGDVKIKGEKGKGTTVTLRMPLNGDQ